MDKVQREKSHESRLKNLDLMSCLRLVGLTIALVVFFYLCILATAYPSNKLIFAITIEVCFFGSILLMRYLSSKRKSQRAKKVVIEEILFSSHLVKTTRKLALLALLSLSICFLFFLLLDFSALVANLAGATTYSRTAYRLVPTYMVYEGAHPALSLELYSGALIEAKKYKEAHHYTDELLQIREGIYGKNSYMYGGMVANLANLYYKEGKYKKAEETYRESLRICQAAQGYHKLGSALTRLGNCLREQGHYDEALRYYQEALSMREKEFGQGSRRVAETTRELAHLMTLMHNRKESDRLFDKVDSAIKTYSKESKTDVTAIVLFAIASVLVSFFLFGKKGILTGIAIKRLENRLKDAGSNADPEDLSKLKTLLEYQGEKDKLERLSKGSSLIISVGALTMENC